MQQRVAGARRMLPGGSKAPNGRPELSFGRGVAAAILVLALGAAIFLPNLRSAVDAPSSQTVWSNSNGQFSTSGVSTERLKKAERIAARQEAAERLDRLPIIEGGAEVGLQVAGRTFDYLQMSSFGH